MVLRCVSVYRPVLDKANSGSVWNQHKRYLESQNDDRDPQAAFWLDLRSEIEEWLLSGDQLIIGGDVNDEVRSPFVDSFFSDLGLHNLIFEHHDPSNAPTTYFRNKKNKVMDGLWGTANISAVRCGYLEPHELPGDHSALWIDVSFQNALGHRPPPSPTPKDRHLQLSQPSTVKKYLRVYKQEILKSKLPAQQFRLKKAASPGVPLTPEQVNEAEAIDLLKTKAMLKAERRCKHLFMGTVSFSLAVDAP